MTGPVPDTRPANELHGWLVYLVDTGLDEMDWSQAQLADAAGITEKHLSQILNGRERGSLDLWDRLLALLGVRDRALGGSL